MAYRLRFGRDVLIDLIGYRRFGHNEGRRPPNTASHVRAVQRTPDGAQAPRRVRSPAGVIQRRGPCRSARRRALAHGCATIHQRAPCSFTGDRRTREHECAPGGTGAVRIWPRRLSPRTRLRAGRAPRVLEPSPYTRARQNGLDKRALMPDTTSTWAQRKALRLGVAARGRDPDPPDRTGHRARHVLPAPPGAARRRDRRVRVPDPTLLAAQRAPSRSSTPRFQANSAASVSNTATRRLPPSRSCSGRPSSATSSTAPRW